MLESGQKDTGINSDVIQLCTALTAQIHSLANNRRDPALMNLANSVFVCATCDENESRYYKLSKMYDSPGSKSTLKDELTSVSHGTMMRLFYRLGRTYEELSKRPEFTSEYQALEVFADSIENGNLDFLFQHGLSLKKWFACAERFLRTLEVVPFHNSLATQMIDSELYSFLSVERVDQAIRTQEKDKLFLYGSLCEKILFASRQDLHWCYLPQSNGALATKKWAICLWADRTASIAFKRVKNTLEEKIKGIWKADNRAKAGEEFATEVDRGWQTDVEWNEIYSKLMDELQNSIEAETMRKRLRELNNAYMINYDYKKRSEFVEAMKAQKNEKIAESLDLHKASGALGLKDS